MLSESLKPPVGRRDGTEAVADIAVILRALPYPFAVLAAERDAAGAIRDFRWLGANPAMAALLGQESHGVAAAGLIEVMPQARSIGLFDQLAETVERNGTLEVDHLLPRDGKDLRLRVHAVAFDGKAAVTITDLSSQKEMELALERQRDRAEAADHAKLEFLAAVSHQLRTPLNSIIGFAEIMKDGLFGPVPHARYQDYVQDIFKAGKHMLVVVDNFLDRKRLEGLGHLGSKGYRHLIEVAPDMICLLRDGRIHLINAAGAALLGVWPAREIIGRPIIDFLHPDYHPLAEDGMACLIGETQRMPMKFIRRDGREADVEVGAVLYREEGEPDSVMLVARDATERNRAVRAVMAREERLRKIMETVAEGIVILDEHGAIDTLNPAAEEMFGYEQAELAGQSVSVLLADLAAGPAAFRHSLGDAGESGRVGETQGRRKDGSAFFVDLAVNSLELGDKRLFIAVVHDITRRKQAEQHLRFLAGHDSLTGLCNRSLFQERLAAAIDNADRNGDQVAVLFVDIDNFKGVNDTMGHRFGDQVLQAVARRLEGCVRHHDTVARLGGDEFTMILPRIKEHAAAAEVARDILAQLLHPFNVEGKEIFLSGSAGIALYPTHGGDMASVLKHVDMAAHHAKRLGGNNFQFFSEDLGAKAVERAALEKGLRYALGGSELSLVYQPKVDLRTGRTCGLEALLRWNSAELGPVSPAVFIPVAEETGLIQPIGDWVLAAACTQINAWVEAGLEPVPVAVNLSARQFRQRDLVTRVRHTIRSKGIDPALLELELTESMLVDNAETAIATMRALKELGVRLSIDDFGTGYSSLAYLKRFPVDALKIDRSFVKDIPDDADDVAISRAIINMAQNLDLVIIAEGVENALQVEFLREQGCNEAQGFFFSRPLPPGELVGDAAAGWPSWPAL